MTLTILSTIVQRTVFTQIRVCEGIIPPGAHPLEFIPSQLSTSGQNRKRRIGQHLERSREDPVCLQALYFAESRLKSSPKATKIAAWAPTMKTPDTRRGGRRLERLREDPVCQLAFTPHRREVWPTLAAT